MMGQADLFARQNRNDTPHDDPLPAVVEQGTSATVRLTFENHGGTSGKETARIGIYTDHALVPYYPLDVVVERVEHPTCEPAFEPELLWLGPHPSGAAEMGRRARLRAEARGWREAAGDVIEFCAQAGSPN